MVAEKPGLNAISLDHYLSLQGGITRKMLLPPEDGDCTCAVGQLWPCTLGVAQDSSLPVVVLATRENSLCPLSSSVGITHLIGMACVRYHEVAAKQACKGSIWIFSFYIGW